MIWGNPRVTAQRETTFAVAAARAKIFLINPPDPMNHLTRRDFFKTSALAAAGVALSARSWGQVAGANSDVRVAVVGLNGRGKNHLASLKAIKGVRIVALCDIDTAVLERAAP